MKGLVLGPASAFGLPKGSFNSFSISSSHCFSFFCAVSNAAAEGKAHTGGGRVEGVVNPEKPIFVELMSFGRPINAEAEAKATGTGIEVGANQLSWLGTGGTSGDGERSVSSRRSAAETIIDTGRKVGWVDGF